MQLNTVINLLTCTHKLFPGPYTNYFLVHTQTIFWSIHKLFPGPYTNYFLVHTQTIYWSIHKLFPGPYTNFFVHLYLFSHDFDVWTKN